jgi:hypothetical protein
MGERYKRKGVSKCMEKTEKQIIKSREKGPKKETEEMNKAVRRTE